mgnify:CR=1 FL=1
MQYLNNNTRKYPRTSIEAFPCTTDYACSLERPCKKGKFMQDTAKLIFIMLLVSFCASMLASVIKFFKGSKE